MFQVKDLFQRPMFLIKLVELGLAVLCIGFSSVHLTQHAHEDFYYKMEVAHGTFIGFALVGLVVIGSFLLETPLHDGLCLAVSAVGAFLFLSSGALVFEMHTHYSSGLGAGNLLAAGVLSFFNFIVYATDFGLTFLATRSSCS